MRLPRPNQAPDVAGPLVQRLDLEAVAAVLHGPLPRGPRLHDQHRGALRQDELAERGAGHGAQLRLEPAPLHYDVVAIDGDLDGAAIHGNEVLHVRSSRVTVSTWAVWGKRSKARTALIR
jgi:hypothetical protein